MDEKKITKGLKDIGKQIKEMNENVITLMKLYFYNQFGYDVDPNVDSSLTKTIDKKLKKQQPKSKFNHRSYV